jgi:hypothetical protein
LSDRADKPAKPGRDHAGRFLPGQSGNPSGTGTGSRRRTAISAQAFLDEKAEELVRVCFERAVAGDGTALRVCMDRVLPIRRERMVEFSLPPITTASDIVTAANAIAAAVATGMLTPGEAASLSVLINNVGRAIELHEHEKRISALEAANAKP